MKRAARTVACLVVVAALPLRSVHTQHDTLQAVVPLNINHHLYYVSNALTAGFYGSKEQGSTFPAHVCRVAYVDGFLWGGYVTSESMRSLCVGGVTYISGVRPGAIVSGQLPAGYEPARVYRIRKDFQTADLRADAADYFSKDPAQVVDEDIVVLRRQYERDWSDWPTPLGAPFVDANGNGLRDPGEDPGFLDADMVCWSAANDLDSVSTFALYGSPPIGIEVQTTWWAYKGVNDALANSIFVRYRILFKGTPFLGGSTHVDSVFVTKFVDPDLGSSADDLLGCDTTLQVGYVYNGRASDYDDLPIVPPAVGWQLLQGPVSPPRMQGDQGGDLRGRMGAGYLRLHSFFAKMTGSSIADPGFGRAGLDPMYRWMRGYIPDRGGPLRLPMNDQGREVLFMHTGDPVLRTGDLDGLGSPWSTAPGDRRFLMNAGPFTMALGDTQDVVYAVVGGAGKDRLRNVDYMKWFAKKIQQAYPDLASLRELELEPTPTPPEVPSRFTLWSNYPNPFNPGTTIRFDLPQSSTVRLAVYDCLGREVRLLAGGVHGQGTHFAQWDGRDQAGSPCASGVYFARLQVDGLQAVKRMVLMR